MCVWRRHLTAKIQHWLCILRRILQFWTQAALVRCVDEGKKDLMKGTFSSRRGCFTMFGEVWLSAHSRVDNHETKGEACFWWHWWFHTHCCNTEPNNGDCYCGSNYYSWNTIICNISQKEIKENKFCLSWFNFQSKIQQLYCSTGNTKLKAT